MDGPAATGDDGNASAILASAVERLSLARTFDEIHVAVAQSARSMAGADGATVVLRDADECVYVEEDAVGPLWKGQHFPLDRCIPGWSMLHRQVVTIPDITDDPRVEQARYRATFVRALAMVPMRRTNPLGAIGVYWSATHQPTPAELRSVQTLADSTAVAIQHVRMLHGMEDLVAERTADLRARTRELEDTNRGIRALYAELVGGAGAEAAVAAALAELSHDVNTPLAAARLLLEDAQTQPADADLRPDLATAERAMREALAFVQEHLRRTRLPLSPSRSGERLAAVDLATEFVGLAALFRALADGLGSALVVDVPTEPILVRTDGPALRQVLRNLISNALRQSASGDVRVHAHAQDGQVSIAIADRGSPSARPPALAPDPGRSTNPPPGVDPNGTEGLGLGVVRRLTRALGGTLQVEAVRGRGSTFTVTLPVD